MEVIISIIILLVILYITNYIYRKNITYVKSKVDGKIYLVRNTTDKQEGADRLAHIKKRCDMLVEYIKNNQELMQESEYELLVQRYSNKKTEFTEKDKLSNFTSYTENKGEKIVFCMRQRNDKEELIDINTMMFVAIHEMAHIMTKDIGHHKEFWVNFKKLLKISVDLEIYQAEDYKTTPRSYCGMEINTNPLF